MLTESHFIHEYKINFQCFKFPILGKIYINPYTEHCSVWFYQLIDYYGQDDARKRMTEKGFLRWPDGAIRKMLFIYHCSVRSSVCVLVPNTAVFGSTNLLVLLLRPGRG